jgi:hypothetical protein
LQKYLAAGQRAQLFRGTTQPRMQRLGLELPAIFKCTWLEKAGVQRQVRLHGLRHTCAPHLILGSWDARGRLRKSLTSSATAEAPSPAAMPTCARMGCSRRALDPSFSSLLVIGERSGLRAARSGGTNRPAMLDFRRRPAATCHRTRRLGTDERGLSIIGYVVVLVLILAAIVELWRQIGGSVHCQLERARRSLRILDGRAPWRPPDHAGNQARQQSPLSPRVPCVIEDTVKGISGVFGKRAARSSTTTESTAYW